MVEVKKDRGTTAQKYHLSIHPLTFEYEGCDLLDN